MTCLVKAYDKIMTEHDLKLQPVPIPKAEYTLEMCIEALASATIAKQSAPEEEKPFWETMMKYWRLRIGEHVKQQNTETNPNVGEGVDTRH